MTGRLPPRPTRLAVLASALLACMLTACGASRREQLDKALGELESVVAVLEGCGSSEAIAEAMPRLEEASQRALELTAEMEGLPEEERKAFAEKYRERISSVSKRYLRQAARAALTRDLRSAAGNLLKNMAKVWKRLSPLSR